MTKESGSTTVKRWIAECDFYSMFSTAGRDVVPGSTGPCEFNNREHPTIHKTVKAAKKEAAQHAAEAGHVGAREVQVKRRREVVAEEIVT